VPMTGRRTMSSELSQHEVTRYSRHLLLPEVGLEGQGRLRSGSVLVVGAGGLGSPALLYLAAAGVGTLGIVDSDTLDETNLQRQVVHGTSAVGTSKAASAAARVRDLNPHVALRVLETRLTADNALDICRGFDVVVDGSDNFPTRYLVNDACVLLGIPYVYGAIFRFDGQASVFGGPTGPCYRCLFREPPPPGLVPSCDEAGVLGVLPGIIGSIQALEAIKLLLGIGTTLEGRLVLFNALNLEFRELAIRRDPTCPICGTVPTIRELIDYEAFCGHVDKEPKAENEITAAELARELGTNGEVVLLDVREPLEWDICHIPESRLIPMGTLPQRLGEFDPQSEIVTICHHGRRSLRAVDILRDAGFQHVRSLKGGVAAWADVVDPAMPRY